MVYRCALLRISHINREASTDCQPGVWCSHRLPVRFLFYSSLDWAWDVFGTGVHIVLEHHGPRLDLVITPVSWPSPYPLVVFLSISLPCRPKIPMFGCGSWRERDYRYLHSMTSLHPLRRRWLTGRSIFHPNPLRTFAGCVSYFYLPSFPNRGPLLCRCIRMLCRRPFPAAIAGSCFTWSSPFWM